MMKRIKIILRLLKERGAKSVWDYRLHRLKNQVKTPGRLPGYKELIKYFDSKRGLEIGGPSRFFNRRGPFPIYPVAGTLDNVNYAPTTVWTGEIDELNGYRINKKQRGRQYIFDAIDLSRIESETYDFVFSCNVLEHFANPLRALEESLGVLKKGGILVIVVPKKESNFDHRRKIVKMEHLLKDYYDNTPESDMSHFSEIMELHDLHLDPMAGTKESFRARSLKNIENRCLHHHVFDMNVMKKIFDHFNLKVIKTYTIQTAL